MYNFDEIFEKEYAKYSHKLEDPEAARVFFNKHKNIIAALPIQAGAIELLSIQSIKFSLKIKDKYLITYHFPLRPVEEFPEGVLIYCYFINRELIISDYMSLDGLQHTVNTFIEEFKRIENEEISKTIEGT